MRGVFLLLVLAQACSGQGQAPSQSPSTPQLILQGRFSPGNPAQGQPTLPQTFSWPATSITTSFEASVITVTLIALPSNGSITYGINWFRFYIDDQIAADGYTSYNQLNLTVALTASSGDHTLRITKINEANKGEAVLQSITLSADGRFLPTKLPSSMLSGKRMLILGDSYSVGYADAGTALPNTCQPTAEQLASGELSACSSLQISSNDECASYWGGLNENAMEAFGPQVASVLDADYQLLGWSGSGLVGYSWASEAYPSLSPQEWVSVLPSNQALFNRSIAADGSTSYPMDSWVPQVVLIASGTNDWHTETPLYTLDAWLAEAAGFLKQISSTFNNPTIIIIAWPEEQQVAGALSQQPSGQQSEESSLNATFQYLQAMPSLFTEALLLQIPNTYYLQLNTLNYDDLYVWCDQHPSAVAHRAIAAQVVAFISSIKPAWANTTAVPMTVPLTDLRPSTSLYSNSAETTAQLVVQSAG